MADPVLDASAGPRDEAAALALLRHGELDLEGLLAEASNTTLRAVVSLDGVTARCIYKPVRGERPLWDFPDGTLAGRELSAYLVSVAGGWGVVPPTVLRDGPLGPGACQLWIDDAHAPDAEQLVGFVPADTYPEQWRAVTDAEGPGGRRYVLAHADDPRLASIAVFDTVVNNADRKGGHVLVAGTGTVYGVDHGVCFHSTDKLRTVLWGWADEPLPPAELDRIDRLVTALRGEGRLRSELAGHLTRAELTALVTRVRRLRRAGRYPLPGGDWPPLPWPPM